MDKKLALYTAGILGIIALVLAYIYVSPSSEPSPESIISTPSLTQSSDIAINQPVIWTVIVKQDQVTEAQHLVELPKLASGIKLSTATVKEAEDAKTEIIAFQTPVSETGNYFTASLASAAENILNSISEKLNKNIISSKDAKFVDLNSVAGNVKNTATAGLSAMPDSQDLPEYIKITYTTPAPTKTEKTTSEGKQITVSAPDELGYENVLAFAKIPETMRMEDKDKIKLQWQTNNNQPTGFTPKDTNNNGLIDQIEWRVPHLSTQTYLIVLISDAVKLNIFRQPAENVYQLVKEKDDNWVTIQKNNYVRATFEHELTNKNDITIYARPVSGLATVEVYAKDSNELLATFETIDKEGTYKIYLENLETPTATFDLKVMGGAVEFDYITDPSWLTGYSYRKAITIDHTYADSDLTDFPLYVKISADADIGDGALATGYDIRFTTSDGSTIMPYERMSWTGGGGADVTANFWVKVPTVAGASNTIIYIYYGDADAVDGNDATNVWDANYVGVWHLQESGTGSSGDYKDSTSNNNDSTSTANQPTRVTGKFGYAQSFDGTNDQIIIPNSTSLQNLTSLTMEMVVNIQGFANGTDWNGFMMKGAYNNNGYGFLCNDDANGLREYVPGIGYLGITGGFSTPAWCNLVGTGSATELRTYKNGISLGSSAGGTIAPGAEDFAIGSQTNGAYYTQELVQEVRISKSVRTIEWLKFQWANFNEADNELTFATEEINWEDWGHRKAITIDHTYADSDLTGFPLYVKIAADANMTEALATGYDIRFTTSDGATTMPYERMSWSGGNGSAVTADFWVKVPTIAGASNTTIYIVWGLAGAPDGNDPTNVWDSNYVGVRHMQESGDGTADEFKDSTANANHGTGGDGASGDTPDRVAGKIGYAQDFVKANTDFIRTTDSVTHNIGTGDFTMEAWAKPDEVNAAWYTLTSSGNYLPALYLTYDSANHRIGEYWESGGGQETADLTPDTNWQFVAMKRTSGTETFFRNTTKSATTKDRSTSSMANADFMIGYDGLTSECMNGLIQEVRFSKNARSDAWLKFEAANMDSTGEADYEISFASEETPVVANTVPSITSGPSDGGSSSGTPTHAGSNVTFTATATDSESDNYYLAICTTNAVTTGNAAAPTCDVGNWCISTSTVQGEQATCSYTTDSEDIGEQAWYAFVCDHNASGECSVSSQASGDNGSPFVVDPAWLTGYSYRKKITIQTANVDADLTDFPLLVQLDGDTDIGAGLQDATTCNDIRFTSSDGSTELKYEKENCAVAVGAVTANFWVNTPVTTAGTGATDIYVYYGKAGDTDGQDATNVWDSNYVAVWHLQESGDGTANEFIDSANSNHGTGGGGNSAKVPDRVEGKFGYAQDIDGTALDYIATGSISHGIGAGVFTIEMWVKPDSADTGYQGVWESGIYAPIFYARYGSGVTLQYGGDDGASNLSITTNWQHISVARRSDNKLYYYLNAGGEYVSAEKTWNIGNSTTKIGYCSDGRGMAGLMQEVRLSNIDRTAAWLKFEYNNINEADNELTFSAEEGSGSAPAAGSGLRINGGNIRINGGNLRIKNQ